MIRPPASSRLVLLEDRRGGAVAEPAAVRRYRLMRLRFDAAPVTAEHRFEYLRRGHD